MVREEIMTRFIGRDQEIDGLKSLMDKGSASLVIIKGRRRIGKSRLAEEFGKQFQRCCIFTGLPPTPGISAKHQKEEFLRYLKRYHIPTFGTNDWGDLFEGLSLACKSGKILIVIDEISWMGMKDPTFLGKLKTAWDNHFKKNPQLIMILSGSQSTWIEKNIINSSGFVGRIAHQLTLEELPLSECNRFWHPKENTISSYEKLKILAVTGGVPRYLEEIKTNQSAEENIKRLCFHPEGLLFNEFEQIFSDLFSKRSRKYKKIVTCLSENTASLEDVAGALRRNKGGDISQYLDDLCKTGFVSRDYAWDIKAAAPSKLSKYRLSDNYIRFYLKNIEPNKSKILSGLSGQLPASWLGIMGLQFENLVLGKKNRLRLYELLGISLNEIVWSNPFFQTKTLQRRGCQIDLMIQTKFNTLYLCEIKFSKQKVEKDIIQYMEQKIRHLTIPRNYSIRPVLIHVNGVGDSVLESEFFSHIVDYGDLLHQG